MILECVSQLPATRQDILRFLKRHGPSTTADIASEFGMTHEGARKHVLELVREGWLSDDCGEDAADGKPRGAGRPAVRYCLTPAGDHFFAKAYDDLLLALLRITAEDGEQIESLLTRLTDQRVAALEPRVQGKTLAQRARALRSIYVTDDAYTDVVQDGEDYLVVERNCPYLATALSEPAICSTTVSTIRRLTGHDVIREKRFHDNDGCCVFRILGMRRAPKRLRFEIEPDPPRIPNSVVGILD